MEPRGEIHVPTFLSIIFCPQLVCQLFDDNNGVKSFMKELTTLIIKSITDPPEILATILPLPMSVDIQICKNEIPSMYIYTIDFLTLAVT